jgi:predicted kinase
VRPFLVLISGAPGSGKTTLGWELARALHVPFVSRDAMKTGLHVTHRSEDPADVWRFAERAFDDFFEVLALLAAKEISVVAEAALHHDRAAAPIDALATVADLVHVALVTPTEVAVARYRHRADSGERHPAHNDSAFAAEMEAGTRDLRAYRLDLPHPTIAVDASDGYAPALDAIVAFVLGNRSGALK